MSTCFAVRCVGGRVNLAGLPHVHRGRDATAYLAGQIYMPGLFGGAPRKFYSKFLPRTAILVTILTLLSRCAFDARQTRNSRLDFLFFEKIGNTPRMWTITREAICRFRWIFLVLFS